MCLARVYVSQNDGDSKKPVMVMDKVVSITNNVDHKQIVRCKDLFGNCRDMEGQIIQVDLENSIVYIATE